MNTPSTTAPPSPAEVRRLAEEASASGLYCAQAVVSALAKAQGIDSELIPRMATAFCSGMSQTRGPCGALTGAIMGLGLALGRSHGGESANASHAATQALVRSFEAEFGARDCDQLLGCDIGTPEGQTVFRERRLHRRCARYTARAAEIAATLLARDES
jgi:C_GCAxxG_C_C family probable redox protein